MINSRLTSELTPPTAVLATKLKERCALIGIDLIFTSTYRDNEAQDALYAQGRTAPGKIVTNARGGQSAHNFRIAFDVVPVQNGKAVWNNLEVWKQIGAIGKELGLQWAGDWKKFKEFPHFQLGDIPK